MLINLLRVIITRSFKPFIFEKSRLQRPVEYSDLPNLGLYVHVPFCREICPFCPYYKVKYDASLASRYVKTLINEIHLKSSSGKKKKVTSLYFGGGSPALIIDYLGGILETFSKYFIAESNIGIELHPDNVNPNLISTLKDIGFDIISLGVQSFNGEILQILGRKEKSNNRKKLEMIAGEGFKAIDVDIIFGIPGQTTKAVEEDLRKAAEYGATQISTYPFIDFSYTNNLQKPLNRKEKKVLLDTIIETTEKIGFNRTSVWTFARKNTPRYSSVTRENYLGFGPSATTLLRKDFRINTFSVTEYINMLKNNNIPTALILNFSERARELFWLFWSCYNLSIDKENFFKLFNKNLDSEFWFEKKIGELLGVIEDSKNGYKLNNKGVYLFHLVEQKYTDQYIDKTWRIARENPWPEKIVLY